MGLDEKFASVRTAFYDTIGKLFTATASQFGYPDNPGMPTITTVITEGQEKFPSMDSLPKRITYFPPDQCPETWFEMIFGPAPKVEPLPRYIYETQEEGFYNFYIENYKNLFFLPDSISEFIQVNLNICLDISTLEVIREVLFIALVCYSQIVVYRLLLAWFITINPYLFPWSYLVTAVDWLDDTLQGIIPGVFGVNITGGLILGAIGALADSLNHLVFTMPFLPSEGEPTQLVINNQLKDVLVFHYLPTLWYKHPIPNDIREFWFTERPDILEYMKTAYGHLDLTLFPDSYIIHQQEMVGLSFLTDNFHSLF